MERSSSQKQTHEQYVVKCKDRFDQRAAELAQLDNPVDEKGRLKRDRALVQLKQADADFRAAVEKLKEVDGHWRQDMTACAVVILLIILGIPLYDH